MVLLRNTWSWDRKTSHEKKKLAENAKARNIYQIRTSFVFQKPSLNQILNNISTMVLQVIETLAPKYFPTIHSSLPPYSLYEPIHKDERQSYTNDDQKSTSFWSTPTRIHSIILQDCNFATSSLFIRDGIRFLNHCRTFYFVSLIYALTSPPSWF